MAAGGPMRLSAHFPKASPEQGISARPFRRRRRHSLCHDILIRRKREGDGRNKSNPFSDEMEEEKEVQEEEEDDGERREKVVG